jgi:hypothetical protein
MLITKEQQEAMIAGYIRSGRSGDEVIGFYDGMTKMLELVERLDRARREIKQ